MIFSSVFFLIGGVAILIFTLTALVISYDDFNTTTKIEAIALILTTIVLYPKVVFGTFFGIGLCVLDVNQDMVFWRCPCHKTVMINLNDSINVGIAKVKLTKNIKTPEIPGDELCYIYLSSYPVTQKTKERITWKLPRKGLIYFLYSDDLCLHLIEILPSEKTTELLIFYNRMQAMDRIREREKKIAEMKEIKKKERNKKK